ncbi:hypothetical protein BD311DRAFT_161152 [Dichomitus squalens]|uniref:Heterokaryon incompatibility domain-containing protein n=1 Tax=Dichomitus squalens TaxID=114155 RepID=A0A4Q9MUE5_9APHY|nr:hypothetical protein BD311DRAFT_161152 [Dichomitus squalens]
MRLLNVKTGQFELVTDPREVRYAILSHTWNLEGEPTYQDVCQIQKRCGPPPCGPSVLSSLPEKIRRFCELARDDGFELVWTDTCCINKADHTELVEIMNSMFDWYGLARVCYVYLPDVLDDHNGLFIESRWFTRKWTLQELIAPSIVLFFGRDWALLGSKNTLSSLVKEITGIDRKILALEQSVDDVPMANRMAWGSHRKSTRQEDEAYSMMGILGVSLQPMYGERETAFWRLQVEAYKRCPDHTLLAWGPSISLDDLSDRIPHLCLQTPDSTNTSSLLCHRHHFYASQGSEPDRVSLSLPTFARQLGISGSSLSELYASVTFTHPPGHMILPTVVFDGIHIALLPCTRRGELGLFGLAVVPSDSQSVQVIGPLYRGREGGPLCHDHGGGSCYSRLLYLSENDLTALCSHPPVMKSVYPLVHIQPNPMIENLRWFKKNSRPRSYLQFRRFLENFFGRPVSSFPKPKNHFNTQSGASDSEESESNADGPMSSQASATGDLDVEQRPKIRLIETHTGKFDTMSDPHSVHYAILSHRWLNQAQGSLSDQSYQDICRFHNEQAERGDAVLSRFDEKLRHFCSFAWEDGFRYGWADTCCIDKSNPWEVEEAIPAMYDWYAHSTVCYVFLHDVHSTNWREELAESEWFDRGWTLQELLAPRKHVFVSKD